MTGNEAGNRPPSPKWAPVGLDSVVAADKQAVVTTDPPKPRVDPDIGRIFGGKYRVIDRLGSGGMAVVYRAQEQGMLTREVAIKVLTPESALSQATISRFLKEAQAISAIGHTNVVQLIELGRTEEGQVYLVMERLLGKTLHEILKEMAQRGETFSWETLAPIIIQICRALHAAHKQKIIHRDMKPSNCFCCDLEEDEWHIKVLDFGIAKVQSSGTSDDSIETPLTQEGMFLGTPHYAAPEIITRRSEEAIDSRVDVFALGVMMYQCLTGTLPFQEVHHDRLAVLYKTAHERPEPPRQRAPDRNIPPEVEAIVMRAMEIDVERRFRTVADLMAAIRVTLRTSTSPSLNERGVLVSGSILELTPPPTSLLADQVTPNASQVGSQASGVRRRTDNDGSAAALTAARRVIVQPSSESPTAVQPPAARTSQIALAALGAMLLALVVLVVLIVRESADSPPNSPPGSPSEAKPADRLRPAVLPGTGDSDKRTPAGTAKPDNGAPPEDRPPRPPPPDPKAVAQRKQAIREQLDELARDRRTLACLPSSIRLADRKFDELPVLLTVAADGSATASTTTLQVTRRLPADTDTCVLSVLKAANFASGDGTVKVSHVLQFD